MAPHWGASAAVFVGYKHGTPLGCITPTGMRSTPAYLKGSGKLPESPIRQYGDRSEGVKES